MLLYQNKEKPWKHVCIRKKKYERHCFFKLSRVPNNTWLLPPRFFAMVNLFVLSFWRDNSNLCFGIGFGKKHFQIVFHS